MLKKIFKILNIIIILSIIVFFIYNLLILDTMFGGIAKEPKKTLNGVYYCEESSMILEFDEYEFRFAVLNGPKASKYLTFYQRDHKLETKQAIAEMNKCLFLNELKGNSLLYAGTWTVTFEQDDIQELNLIDNTNSDAYKFFVQNKFTYDSINDSITSNEYDGMMYFKKTDDIVFPDVMVDRINGYDDININRENYYYNEYSLSEQYSAIVEAEIGLNVRTGPATDYEKTDYLKKGTVVTIYGCLNDGGEYLWYKIGENRWIADDGTWISKYEIHDAENINIDDAELFKACRKYVSQNERSELAPMCNNDSGDGYFWEKRASFSGDYDTYCVQLVIYGEYSAAQAWAADIKIENSSIYIVHLYSDGWFENEIESPIKIS